MTEEPLNIIVQSMPAEGWITLLSTWAPIVLALVATIISVRSFKKSSEQFLQAQRPYLWVENFGSKDSKGKLVTHPEKTLYLALNSPANIFSASFSWKLVSKDKQSKSIYEKVVSPFIIYPDNRTQITETCHVLPKFIKDLTSDQHIERLISITYSDLSRYRSYTYNVVSKFTTKDGWEHTSMEAT